MTPVSDDGTIDESVPVAVIGAGPAGLAVAASLRRRGISAVVFEREAQVGASWRGHYDRLHLHTVRWLSQQPGFRIPRKDGPWVARDDLVRYLENYAHHHRLDVRTGVRIDTITRDQDGWILSSPEGRIFARSVVVATGYNHTPVPPEWPGSDGFTRQVLHAADYRSGAPFRGQDVLVVGAGNTGAEIAVDLTEHGAARVRLAIRSPPHIMRRSMLGVPTQLVAVLLRWLPVALKDRLAVPVRAATVPRLSHKGMPDPTTGLFTHAAQGAIPILDVGLIDAVLHDRVEPVAAVTGFDGASVHLSDGSVIEPDAIIVATGYRRGLESMVGHLGVLDAAGRPTVHGSQTHPAAPGLHFIGYTNPISGVLREIGIEARRIAGALK